MSDALSAPGQASEERPSSDASMRLLQSEWLWAWVLAGGAAIWLVTAVATGLTDLDHLIPNVVLLGSFLVPISLVLFALARTGDGYLKVEQVILGFLGGGLLGTVFAGVTETYLLPKAAGTFVAVGLFEETAKAAVLVLIGTRMPVRRGRDGMILGATLGRASPRSRVPATRCRRFSTTARITRCFTSSAPRHSGPSSRLSAT
jgi:hypothetical protein